MACIALSPLFSTEGKAFADSNGSLMAQSTDGVLQTQSGGFTASTYYLDLSPKVTNVPYGHKYTQTHKTVTINIPDPSYYPVRWKSSNAKVATAKDSYKRTAMRLTVYGNAHGKATITITNAATYETIKINIVVNGYDYKDFLASKTSLDLSPKQKKVSGGYKYTEKSESVVVAFPDGTSGSWKSSNPSIATAKWSNKWVGNTIKLTITGHAQGSATITLDNKKTKKKVKIKVVVGGSGLQFDWGNEEKKTYTKSDGSAGRYWIDNFTLTNKTGKKITFDKNCSFRVWAVNPNYDEEYDEWLDSDEDDDMPVYRTWNNEEMAIRGVPISIAKNAKKKIYIGENRNYRDTSSWEKGIFTVRVGSAYKTVYVNKYGAVTKILNGRKI